MECGCRIKERTDEDKKKMLNRLARIQGQIGGIKKMIEDNRYCPDILTQLAALDKSIKSLSSELVDEHLHTCVVDDIKKDNFKTLDEVADLFKKFN